MAFAGSVGKNSSPLLRPPVVLIARCYYIRAIHLGHLCLEHIPGLSRARSAHRSCPYTSCEAGACPFRRGFCIQHRPYSRSVVRVDGLRPCIWDCSNVPHCFLDRGFHFHGHCLVHSYRFCRSVRMHPGSKGLGFVCPRSLPRQAGYFPRGGHTEYLDGFGPAGFTNANAVAFTDQCPSKDWSGWIICRWISVSGSRILNKSRTEPEIAFSFYLSYALYSSNVRAPA